MPAEVLDVRSLDAIQVAGVNWRRVRQALGVSAFGTNAYTAEAGELLIEEHDEAGVGHEELYVVLHGRATFTVDGTELDVPAGSLVFVAPGERRVAYAAEDRTTALVVGGAPGTAGPPSAWEHRFAAAGESDPERAYAIAAEGLADHPDDASLHYDLGCFAARAGRREQALGHLRTAFAADPSLRDEAAEDEDLESVRDAL